jgi:hypothetical protein
MKRISLLALLIVLLPGAVYSQNDSEQWISLFNGENLNNWIPKFTGHELGVNYRDTFRAEDGVFKVSYDNWPDFDGEFGHIFYDESFSHYRLLVEYRFVGDQVKNGPGWAFRNNGVMLHGQSPQSMTLDQEFPASIEVQLLGGNGTDERATANVCSPGTHYVKDGELVTRHCINSSSATYHGDQWVTLEVEVRGNEVIRHTVNGEMVFEYSMTQLDESDPDAQNLIGQGQPVAVSGGYISLQAESHPTEFRRIDLLPLAH